MLHEIFLFSVELGGIAQSPKIVFAFLRMRALNADETASLSYRCKEAISLLHGVSQFVKPEGGTFL